MESLRVPKDNKETEDPVPFQAHQNDDLTLQGFLMHAGSGFKFTKCRTLNFEDTNLERGIARLPQP
jgi:hypothetical protein